MTEAIPNLWPNTLRPITLSPFAILRTQAARLKELTGGLLEAEVISRDVTRRTDEGSRHKRREHELYISAPKLDYRRGILTAEHDTPGAYPVCVSSWYLLSPTIDPTDFGSETPNTWCHTSEETVEAVRRVLQSRNLTSHIESLIAQINDAEAVPA